MIGGRRVRWQFPRKCRVAIKHGRPDGVLKRCLCRQIEQSAGKGTDIALRRGYSAGRANLHGTMWSVSRRDLASSLSNPIRCKALAGLGLSPIPAPISFDTRGSTGSFALSMAFWPCLTITLAAIGVNAGADTNTSCLPLLITSQWRFAAFAPGHLYSGFACRRWIQLGAAIFHAQAHFPTQPSSPLKDARISYAHEDQERPCSDFASAGQGPEARLGETWFSRIISPSPGKTGARKLKWKRGLL